MKKTKRQIIILALRHFWVLTQRVFSMAAMVYTILAVVSFFRYPSLMGIFLIVIGAVAAVSSWNGADLCNLRLNMSLEEFERNLRLPEKAENTAETRGEANV